METLDRTKSPISMKKTSRKSDDKHIYIVQFPPGAMGLELEPVIRSSERELGCRIKDYYFGVDYSGIEPRKLESIVSIGDIICSVDDVVVRSLPFAEIVDMLRSKRNKHRVVKFKNMTSLCKNPHVQYLTKLLFYYCVYLSRD